MESHKTFTDLVHDDLLVTFCCHYGYPTDGFKSATVDRVSEHDAKWFLNALITGTVVRDGAFFTSCLSAAKEQIFWQGRKAITPRPLTIWTEPVITIGAACRLHTEFGWPRELIGLQSREGWAFDLVAYDEPDNPRIAVEIKKTDREVDYLIEAMRGYLSRPPLPAEPTQQKQRNAYRKVVALRRMRTPLFWALGPNGYGKVFRYHEPGRESLGVERMEEVESQSLNHA